jgi:phage I-like protein
MKQIRIDGNDFQVEDQVGDFCLQASKRADASEKSQAELLAALGTDSHDKAMATAAGLKAKAEQADKALAELATAKAEQLAAKRTAMLDGASRDGRLTPAHRQKLEGDAAPVFAKDPEALAIYLDHLPKQSPEPKEPQSAGQAQLTAEDAEVAKQLGLDPQQVRAAKK